MAFAAPVAVPAMLAATEAGGAGMAAAAAAEAAAPLLAAGMTASQALPVVASAAGSAVPGMAAPAMTAAGTQGLAGAMGPGMPAIEQMFAQMGGGGTAGEMFGNAFGGNQLAGSAGFKGMADTAMSAMPWYKNLAYQAQPFTSALKKAGNAYQMGSKFGNALAGQQQGAQRQIQPPAPAPQINPMPQQTQRTPTPVELLAWRRAQQRKRMMGQPGGMMS